MWLSRQKTEKKNHPKNTKLHLLQHLGLTNIRGHCTVMWDCITVPVNVGHIVRAVQLQGGKREKISSSRRPCILATPLKRHSFWEPRGVLLWPAPNYSHTYFDLEQTGSVGRNPWPRGDPAMDHPAKTLNSSGGIKCWASLKITKTWEKKIGDQPFTPTIYFTDTADTSFL